MTNVINRQSVEYCVVEHCNLSCYGCDHASPLIPARFATLEDFTADVNALRKALHVRTLYLIGGEPLLHPQLPELVRIAHDSELADNVTIVTNGVRLHVMPESVWAIIDGLDVTLYPGVRLRMPLPELQAKADSYGIRLRVTVRNAFRQTLLNSPIHDATRVQHIFDACRIAHDYQCHAVYQGRYYKCSVAPYQRTRLSRVGKALPGWDGDGVRIRDNPDLRADLETYLSCGTPLASCAFCLGTSGRDVAHRLTNEAQRQQWLQEVHNDVEALLDPTRLQRVRPVNDLPARGRRRMLLNGVHELVSGAQAALARVSRMIAP